MKCFENLPQSHYDAVIIIGWSVDSLTSQWGLTLGPISGILSELSELISGFRSAVYSFQG
jgi:hypothetical protein